MLNVLATESLCVSYYGIFIHNHSFINEPFFIEEIALMC